MADEIKQTGNVTKVQPTNPSRGAGQRKRRPAPAKPAAERPPRPPVDDQPHQIDEYA
jgi:hypothetical protein